MTNLRGELLKLSNMQFRTILAFLLIGLVAGSCRKEIFTINEEVSIGYNSRVFIETDSDELEVRYTELINESRCPPDANCLLPGSVEVKLKVDSDYYELGLQSDTADSIIYNNHVIKLLAVEYDSDDDFGKEKRSSVLIQVN